MGIWSTIATALVFERHVRATRHVEKDVEDEFFANLGSYLPGAIPAIAPYNHHHRPDGFVHLDGEILPVEVKRVRFTFAARSQLLRYMGAYGASRGIAVAPALSCEIPANITFVQVSAPEVSA